jgi:hypothetical protein
LLPVEAANNLVLCWFTSTFLGTLGSFANLFSSPAHPVDSLSDVFWGTLGFLPTFLAPNPGHLMSLSDGFSGTLGLNAKIFDYFWSAAVVGPAPALSRPQRDAVHRLPPDQRALDQADAARATGRARPGGRQRPALAFEMLARVARILDQLVHAWNVLATLTRPNTAPSGLTWAARPDSSCSATGNSNSFQGTRTRRPWSPAAARPSAMRACCGSCMHRPRDVVLFPELFALRTAL